MVGTSWNVTLGITIAFYVFNSRIGMRSKAFLLSLYWLQIDKYFFKKENIFTRFGNS